MLMFKPFKDLGKSCHESRVFFLVTDEPQKLALMELPELLFMPNSKSGHNNKRAVLLR